mgnify:CR=1 FL=1
MSKDVNLSYIKGTNDIDIISGYKVSLLYDEEADLWTIVTTRGSITRVDNQILNSLKNVIIRLEDELQSKP